VVHVGESLRVKNIGEPDEGEPHVRFDEGEQGRPSGPAWWDGYALHSERGRPSSPSPVAAGSKLNLFPTLHMRRKGRRAAKGR
jgi:hypothetical protein